MGGAAGPASLGLSGRNVVVTGGTGFLGSAIVRLLVEQGAHVWLPVFNERGLARVELGPNTHAELGVDLSDELQAVRYFSKVPSLWGSVHCTGGFAMGSFLDTSLAELQAMVRLNLETCFLSTREAARNMVASGHGGRIVNVAAQPGIDGSQGGFKVAYAASKAAVANLTQAVSAELVGKDVLVNAIVPSIIDTPPNRASMPDADHSAWATPEEIAQTVGFLLSPRNGVTRGSLVSVAGRS